MAKINRPGLALIGICTVAASSCTGGIPSGEVTSSSDQPAATVVALVDEVKDRVPMLAVSSSGDGWSRPEEYDFARQWESELAELRFDLSAVSIEVMDSAGSDGSLPAASCGELEVHFLEKYGPEGNVVDVTELTVASSGSKSAPALADMYEGTIDLLRYCRENRRDEAIEADTRVRDASERFGSWAMELYGGAPSAQTTESSDVKGSDPITSLLD